MTASLPSEVQSVFDVFSDPTGSDLSDPPMVLVQGTAEVDDRDLDANGQRYERESVEKLPGAAKLHPPTRSGHSEAPESIVAHR